MASNKTCPRCFKASESDRESCVDRDVLGCPDPIAVDESHVLIRCAAPCGGPCGKLFAVPVGNIMKRRRLTDLGTCISDDCRARVVLPKANRGPAPAPPISEVARSQQTGKPAAAGDGGK